MSTRKILGGLYHHIQMDGSSHANPKKYQSDNQKPSIFPAKISHFSEAKPGKSMGYTLTVHIWEPI